MSNYWPFPILDKEPKEETKIIIDENKENSMRVRNIFTNPYLGTFYTIEDADSIMMVAVKAGKVMIVPGWCYTTLDGELDAKKFERKALKALRDYLGN